MPEFVTSADGTRIAFDRLGRGAPLVVVSGMFCERSVTRDLAERLAEQYTVLNYDRRGRGASSDTGPYAPEREIEDLAALIAELGGKAAVYGHSSGAALALRAAAAGLPITRLVLHEPPYGGDGEADRAGARALAQAVWAAIAENRPADAVTAFMIATGLPQAIAEATSRDPRMLAIAPTMPYDLEIMDNFISGGVIPVDLVRGVDIPTLVLLGGASPEFFATTASRLTELLPDGQLVVLEGQDHGAPAEFVVPAVVSFLG